MCAYIPRCVRLPAHPQTLCRWPQVHAGTSNHCTWCVYTYMCMHMMCGMFVFADDVYTYMWQTDASRFIMYENSVKRCFSLAPPITADDVCYACVCIYVIKRCILLDNVWKQWWKMLLTGTSNHSRWCVCTYIYMTKRCILLDYVCKKCRWSQVLTGTSNHCRWGVLCICVHMMCGMYVYAYDVWYVCVCIWCVVCMCIHKMCVMYVYTYDVSHTHAACWTCLCNTTRLQSESHILFGSCSDAVNRPGKSCIHMWT
jgi:hypothetical protein